jgi:hypothetical protein
MKVDEGIILREDKSIQPTVVIEVSDGEPTTDSERCEWLSGLR